MKILSITFLALLFFPVFVQASSLKFYWGGITSITVTDGKTTLLFDPVFNRPPMTDIFFNGVFEIKQAKTEDALKRLKVVKADAIFASHTHHDHYADAPIVSKLTGAKIYGSNTAKFLSLSSGVSEDKIQIVNHWESIKVGDFTITFLKGDHGPLALGFDFLPGELTATVPFPIKLWDYKMGGSYDFLVEHPEGSFIMHETFMIHPETTEFLKNKKIKIGILFQGITKPRYSDVQRKNLWDIVNPQLIVPIHHDNFLFQTDYSKIDLLPLAVDMDAFRTYTSENKFNVHEPKYFEEIPYPTTPDTKK